MLKAKPKAISLVVPVYNEEKAIGRFLNRVQPVLEQTACLLGDDADYEIVFVNDGSQDATASLVAAIAERDNRVKLINLSRNFGKEAALAAGLQHANGDCVIPIDADLQDPPEIIPEMVSKWLAGAQVVNGVRNDRSADHWLKRSTASWFYRLYNRFAEIPIPENVGDFRLLDREVVDTLNEFPECSRVSKDLFSWVGFSSDTVEFRREARSAGTGKWKYWSLWNLAIDGFTASTTVPLRIWTYVGGFFALLSFAYAAYIVIKTLIFGVDTPGYASLITVMLFLGGLNLLSLGILGEYVGRISSEVRRRPLFIVQSKIGF
ncbi:glycosyltransferase family 2 protein [Nitratireductor sp. XY-223]|uniref:glycosyltransferase family 2 protein n=1 Tax=Nitratireductor sp. XY-223 TaxID=2561926 RepID=UPI00145B0A76|nr:glycosyltransferase family 2 protein [Nitratireductor sp. XY-223]